MSDARILVISWIDSAGAEKAFTQLDAESGWSPVAHGDRVVLSRAADGAARLLWFDGEGRRLRTHDYAARPGASPIACSPRKLVWVRDSFSAIVSRLDEEGNPTGEVVHGPFPGWTPISHAPHRLLFKDPQNRISLWRIDELGNQVSYLEHGPFWGWTPIDCNEGRVLFRHDNGSASVWQVDELGNQTSYTEHPPVPGFRPERLTEVGLAYRHTDGRVQLVQLDAAGKRVRSREIGPFRAGDAFTIEARIKVSLQTTPPAPVRADASTAVGKPPTQPVAPGLGAKPVPSRVAPEIPLGAAPLHWTRASAVPGVAIPRAGGVGVFHASTPQGSKLVICFVNHTIHDIERLSAAQWEHVQARIDPSGRTTSWTSGVLMDIQLPNDIGLSTGFLGATTTYGRFSFEGTSAVQLASKCLFLFTRYRKGNEIGAPTPLAPFNMTWTMPAPEGLVSDPSPQASPTLGLAAFPDSARDARLWKGSLRPGEEEEMVTLYLMGDAPMKGYYQVGSTSPVHEVLGDFPSLGLGVSIARFADKNHLVVFGLDIAPGGARYGRYRVGHALDAEGRATRWGPWIYLDEPISGDLQGLSIGVGDVAASGRPDLLLAIARRESDDKTRLYYRVGFNLLDIPPSAGALQTCPLPRRFARSPISALADGARLDLGAIRADGSFHHVLFDGGHFAVGPERVAPPPAELRFAGPPALVRRGDRRDALVVTEDGRLLRQTLGPTLGPWQSLGGHFWSPPTAISVRPGIADVFVLGAGGAVLTSAVGDVEASPWTSLGGRFLFPVTAISRLPGLIELFGTSVDGVLLGKTRSGDAWSPAGEEWQSLGGTLLSAPALVAPTPDTLHVFSLGEEGALLQKIWNGKTWSPSADGWLNLAAPFVSGPVAVSRAPGKIDLFALDMSHALLHRAWDGAAWGTWENLGGVFTSTPVVVVPALDKLCVFGIGTDGALYQRFWTPSGWSSPAWLPVAQGFSFG